MSQWIYSLTNMSNFIADKRLRYEKTYILATLEKPNGKREVRQVICNHGRIEKKYIGRVVAWMPMPEPAQGEANRVQDHEFPFAY